MLFCVSKIQVYSHHGLLSKENKKNETTVRRKAIVHFWSGRANLKCLTLSLSLSFLKNLTLMPMVFLSKAKRKKANSNCSYLVGGGGAGQTLNIWLHRFKLVSYLPSEPWALLPQVNCGNIEPGGSWNLLKSALRSLSKNSSIFANTDGEEDFQAGLRDSVGLVW